MMRSIKEELTRVEAELMASSVSMFGGDAVPVKSEGGNPTAKAAITMQRQLLWASVIWQRQPNGP